MAEKLYDLFIAYYGNDDKGSLTHARKLYKQLQGKRLWKGRTLRVYLHPINDPIGRYKVTEKIIRATPLFLFVVEDNPPVDSEGHILKKDTDGDPRNIYEELEAERKSSYYNNNQNYAAKLYVCGSLPIKSAEKLDEGLFFGKNHFFEKDGSAPVLSWAKEQLKKLQEEGIFPPSGKDFEFTRSSYGYAVKGYFGHDTDVIIPSIYENEPVVSIESGAFFSNLSGVIIPSSVLRIAEDAFLSCTNLENITVAEDNLQYKSIDGNLYSKDSRILFRYAVGKKEKSFQVPNGVNEIWTHAFSGCQSLMTINIPSSVTKLDVSAFSGCEELTSITVAEDNSRYKSIDGNLYSKDGKTLINYAVGKREKKFTVPSGVKKIGEEAFTNCHLTEIIIPNGVTSIGSYAFFGCLKLITVNLPKSVTEIREGAFACCENLINITIPEGITEIKAHTFRNCKKLQDIIIPKSVTTIGDYSFSDCESLTSITFQSPGGWYYTLVKSDWKNRQAGAGADLSNPTHNKDFFKALYNYYWYKK